MHFNGLFLALASITSVRAIDLDLGSVESACNAATTIIDGIMDYYTGYRYGGTVGYFQEPYYWWEGGLAFGAMIDTWAICNNDTYVDMLQASLYHQAGPNFNYMILNQSDVEANDDQVFWGLTVMEAAERGFPAVSDSEDATYLKMAQAVYNTMWERWDDNCGGGLRWQIFSNMSGWDYKSTVANAGLFAMGARLGKYTGNELYFDSCKRVVEWMKNVEFITPQDDYYILYDGANIGTSQCHTLNGYVWSYNYGLMIMGSAYMYNATNDDQWESDLQKYINGLENYMIVDGVLQEHYCSGDKCSNDQRAFRAIVLRALGEVVQLVPSLASTAQKIIDSCATGAAESCSGGSDGHTCGQSWSSGSWDGLYGLGEQICALEAIQNNVISQISAPLDSNDGKESGDFLFGLTGTVTPEIRTNTVYVTNTHTVEATVTQFVTEN